MQMINNDIHIRELYLSIRYKSKIFIIYAITKIDVRYFITDIVF